MPLVSTATSINLVPTQVGQRISQVSYGRMSQEYYYEIDIQDEQFIINIYEDIVEPTFGLEDIGIDFLNENMLTNLEMGQSTLHRGAPSSYVPTTPRTNWSEDSYVVIDDPDVPGGTTATAVLTISSGTVTGIVLTNPGSGYVFMPSVKVYDPTAPVPPGVSLAAKPVPAQLPGGVRVHLDPNTMTTATVTYLRGTLPITIEEFKRRAVNLDHNTLWAFESNIITIEDNKKPNWENAQSAGLDVQMIRFLDAFPYLGKTLSPVQFGKSFQLYQFGRLVNILNAQSVDPTPRLEVPAHFDTNARPFFWIFVHDKNFTSFKDCTWKFNYPQNRREYVHPSIKLQGASAHEFLSGLEASVQTVVNKEVIYHVPPSTDWTQMFDPIYCAIQDEPINAGDPVNVQVTTSPHIDYLYVQQVCGVPDRTRITLTDGVGQFNILTSTLSAGETAAAWVGFKHYPQLVEVFKDLS